MPSSLRKARASAILALSLTATIALPPAVSFAEPAPAAEDLAARAAERKKAGDQAMEGLRYADALAAYGEAYAVTKDPALLYNMGRALQAQSRFPEALEKLRAFEAAASPELKARVPRLAKLIEEIGAKVSTLTIRVNMEGARVLVRDAVVGKAPLPAPLALGAGPAVVEVEAEGFYPAKKSVELVGGGELTVELELASRATTGVLGVKASAPAAEVSIDGKRAGLAPLEVNVAKGTHRVLVRHPDYKPYETSVVVVAGETKSVDAALQRPSVVTRWWFWTGVAVVAAAGAGVAIAAVTERKPDTGTIAPGQLHTGGFRVGATLVSF
jgi:hypothetical protein